MKKLFLLSLTAMFGLIACTSKTTGCGADDVKSSIIEGAKKNYHVDVRQHLDAVVEFAEEVKSDDEKAVRACAATVIVKFDKDISEKYKKVSDQFSKFEFVALHGEQQILEDKVKVNFTVKKNEADGNYFTSGKYESERSWKLNPIVVKRGESFENIINIGRHVESLSKVHSLMGKKEITGAEVKKLAAENELSIESCHDVFYIPTGTEYPSYGLFCRVSNKAGFFNIQPSRRLQDIGNFQELVINSIRANPRVSEGTKINITDATKIDEILTAGGDFKTKSELKSGQACKLAPEMCTD